jgi:uncharacterized protein involved in exopolysaccharide biosynthesis
MAGNMSTAEEVDIRDVLRIMWRGRWLLVAVTILCIATSAAYAYLATPWYRADAVMVPVESRSTPGGLGQLGGLASLAGVNISAGSSTQTPLAILRSRDFARKFIEDNQLLGTLGSYQDWREPFRRSPQPAGLLDIRKAVRLFDERIRAVSEDKKSGLVTISINWIDPAVASDWANLLAARLNDSLRERALAEARDNINFLRAEMASTSVVSMQQSIGRVLESEMQKLLMASAGKDFAFRIVDPAVPPTDRVSPRRSVILVMGALAGVLLSTVLLLVASAMRKS